MNETTGCMYVVIHATGERYAIHRGPAGLVKERLEPAEATEPFELTEPAEVATR